MTSSQPAVTDSRRAMLDRLRSRHVPSASLPEIDTARLIHFDDPLAKFIEMVSAVGGAAHLVDHPEEVAERLTATEAFTASGRIASTVPEAVRGTVDLGSVDDPHDLATLDWTVAAGEFAVAENGAVWVDGRTLPHRAMIFIAQYLALVVSRRRVVHHMHEAYRQIGEMPAGFGVFVSGPSKTADIEQSLVLGAHGCRNLQVFLVP